MPELPEVETLRRSLEPLLVGRRIATATLHRRDVLILPGDPRGGFSRSRTRLKPRPASSTHLLRGATIDRLDRRGKQLAIIAGDGRTLIVHLGMTGQLLCHPAASIGPRDVHAHIRWRLDDASDLIFRDPRRFGNVRFLPAAAALDNAWAALGPDALSISGRTLQDRAHGSRRAIKAVLLDQAILAGVGNIYADESLFLARVHPRRLASRLSTDQYYTLARAVRKTLAAAIDARGSTLRDYRDALGRPGGAQRLHRVYGRAGLPCNLCGTPLSAGTWGQRTTVFCRHCQT